ncbi:MAG TPA: class I SAM-dependent methyltransferase [Solirubrobacteraceae bacterium]|nr:class I SAM-dependent methyltransferase [Solirubrobacteraceae bacterium]
MSSNSGDNISPTAHYTGEVWRRAGLSHPWLGTREGRIMVDALHPLMVVSGALGGPSLESYLLARHRAIDALLTDAVERHGVSQVIEIAAGMSARGWRFANRYGDAITYVEADLPAMAERKRRALARIGSLSDGHRMAEIDARRDEGPRSLAQLAASLDPGAGLAIVTEGLLGYLATDAVLALWRRIATALATFSSGRYISDLHLGSVQTPVVRLFRQLLAGFVRGQVYLHFDRATEAEAALREAGFAAATVRRAGAIIELPEREQRSTAHILEASTTDSERRP